MKYKYEFEFEGDEGFHKGCCYECPLGYIDYDDDCNAYCSLHARWDRCPLEEVKD